MPDVTASCCVISGPAMITRYEGRAAAARRDLGFRNRVVSMNPQVEERRLDQPLATGADLRRRFLHSGGV